MTDGRGLFSTIARMSSDLDRSSGVPVRMEAVTDGTLAASLASAARCPAADDSIRVKGSATVLEGAIVVIEGVVVACWSLADGGTARGGIWAGSPSGGRKGTTGYEGSGTFQSAHRKLSGGLASGATGRCDGGSGCNDGGGTLNIPGGNMGTGRATVLATGGGRGTTRGWSRPCKSEGR